MGLTDNDLRLLRELRDEMQREGRYVYAETVRKALEVVTPKTVAVEARLPPEKVCWRAPNAHPPHQWMEDKPGGKPWWCPGVQGKTMY